MVLPVKVVSGKEEPRGLFPGYVGTAEGTCGIKRLKNEMMGSLEVTSLS